MSTKKKRPDGDARDNRSASTADAPQRTLGLLKGQIWMAPDFDETSEDILRAFEGDFEDEVSRGPARRG